MPTCILVYPLIYYSLYIVSNSDNNLEVNFQHFRDEKLRFKEARLLPQSHLVYTDSWLIVWHHLVWLGLIVGF